MQAKKKKGLECNFLEVHTVLTVSQNILQIPS